MTLRLVFGRVLVALAVSAEGSVGFVLLMLVVRRRRRRSRTGEGVTWN